MTEPMFPLDLPVTGPRTIVPVRFGADRVYDKNFTPKKVVAVVVEGEADLPKGDPMTPDGAFVDAGQLELFKQESLHPAGSASVEAPVVVESTTPVAAPAVTVEPEVVVVPPKKASKSPSAPGLPETASTPKQTDALFKPTPR